MPNRRQFLYQLTGATGGAIALSSLSDRLAQALSPTAANSATANSATANSAAPPKRLIVVLLRGAADGLNIVVPYTDPNYYSARPTIAIPKPGQANGALDLDGRFGLHPALKALHPLWQQGSLAFVHACGSPDPSRSHFDAQDYLESGTPGTKRTADGWMNRLLGRLAATTPIQAVNVGTSTPRILSGSMSVASLASGRQAARRLPLDRPDISAAFDQLYGQDDSLSQTYREGKLARAELMEGLRADQQAEMQAADNGAPLPNGFATDARRLAQLMRRDRRIELAFLGVGGWDTHVNQGASQGQLARRLEPLGQGLAVLAQELGPIYSDTVVLVMSEFGRTVRENGNGGTDHGHGNVLWVLGGGINGGKVYGDWPGLAPAQRYEGRDLAVTTDFRTVVATVLEQHLGLTTAQLAVVLPGFQSPQRLALS